MSDVLSKKNCSSCGGSGREYDRKALNHIVKKLHETQEYQAIATAIGISPSQLTLLMNGQRKWSPEVVEKLVKLKMA